MRRRRRRRRGSICPGKSTPARSMCCHRKGYRSLRVTCNFVKHKKIFCPFRFSISSATFNMFQSQLSSITLQILCEPSFLFPPVVWFPGPSASPLCLVIIACCPTHPSFNHRRSSFYGRCCPTVEYSVTERHVGVVNVVTFEDSSLQSFLIPKSPLIRAQWLCHVGH